MFYPKEMTEIEMIVPAKDLLAVTKILSGRGIFHQADSYYTSQESKVSSPNIWQERAAAYTALERRILNIMQTLGIEEGRPPKGDLETVLEIDSTRQSIDPIDQEVKKISDVLTGEGKRIEQLQATMHQLEPVEDIKLDINAIRSPHFLFSLLGTMPVANMERLQTSLGRVPFVFVPLRTDNHNAVVWLAGPKSSYDILERAARSAYLNPLNLPATSSQGTPSDIIKSLRKEIEEAQHKIDAQKTEVARVKKEYEKQLQTLLWDLRSSHMVADAILRYGRLQYTYLIVGWVISDGLEDLKQKIHSISKETIIETYPIRRDAPNRNVPIALQHNKLLGPFQMLVTTYGRPRYSEIDPTIIMAIMFPLLFGAMFGDLGQGLVLAVLGLLIANKKFLPSLQSLGGVIAACGLSAAVFGVLYGSLFGFEGIFHPLWLNPLENILTILGIAVGAGVILLTIAFILGIINSIKAKDWGKLFFDHFGIAGLVFYWSMLGIVASTMLPALGIPSSIFVVLAVISGVVLMFSEVFRHLLEGHRPLFEGSIGIYIVQAFFEMFETFISFLSNSLSYVRVGAFAVAHGGLSQAIFLLAELASPGHGIGYWITVLLGNLFIVGFEGLIVGIQTMRLSYYEFFGKFFTGGGMQYEPLRIRPSVEE